MSEQEVVIVGAGIAGVATALALKKVGIKSLVLERADELRTTGAALNLLPNAWRALDALGVAHKLEAIYPSLEIGWVTNLESGVVQKMSFTANKQSGRAVGARPLHRKVLLEVLAEELPPGSIRFSSKLASIKTQVLSNLSTVALLELEDGTVIKAKVVIGCDGVHSVVAQWLGLTAPVDSGRAAVRGLAVFPQGHGFKHEVRMFIDNKGKRAGFFPLNDIDIFWFIVHYTSAEKEIERGNPEALQREVTDNLAKDFPSEFLQVVNNADLSTVSWAPLKYRVPWDLIVGRTHKGPVGVAGDAFHPMTPDLAQGGGSALEDAVVLARKIAGMLNAEGVIDTKRVEKGIEDYVKERKWRVAGLISGAYLSGWIQQRGQAGLSGWAVKWFRDHVFYKFVLPRIADAVQYDCGPLPSPST